MFLSVLLVGLFVVGFPSRDRPKTSGVLSLSLPLSDTHADIFKEKRESPPFLHRAHILNMLISGASIHTFYIITGVKKKISGPGGGDTPL